ncbi:MAG: response regulator, partial [Thermoanaerobaculia bacterium]|nr:response regulator [Thermoanaerobaculia bacterium]
MPGGGVLEISTRSEVLTEEEAAQRPGLWPGPSVQLRVSDTGMGMDPETRSRVFEPFFTTKREEGGTGLGLAVSYGIVKQSGGAIHVDSRPGKGTTFKIRFPPARADAERDSPDDSDDSDEVGTKPGVGGSVLAIEDDPSVRRIVRRILERADMDVTLAEDAETGLEILKERGESFEVVLTDLVLPGMSGRGLLEEVRSRDLDVKVVVMSGYDHDSPGSRGDLPSDVWFIQKPFSPEELVEVLGRALGGRPPEDE